MSMKSEPEHFDDWVSEPDGLYWLCEDALTHEFEINSMHPVELRSLRRGESPGWPYSGKDGERVFGAVWQTLIAARNAIEERLFGQA
jgi:hypothetical protein